MSNPMGVRRSSLIVFGSALALAGLCLLGLPKSPLARAQVKPLPAFTPRTISMNSSNDSIESLEKMDEATTDLVSFVSPGVVQIFSKSEGRRDIRDGTRLPSMEGEGSGVVYRPDGYIITNDHVVGGFDEVTVVLADGHRLKGKVTRAEDLDLAVVKVDAKDLQTLPFADSAKVKAGQFAMAVGSPFDLESTVTFGHISAIGRTRVIADDRLHIDRNYANLLQTDAPINMGNSGGPLVNAKGEVVGINTAIYSPTGSSSGIGFAIPSNTVRLVADRLIQEGKITRGALGVIPDTLEPYRAKELGIEGGAKVTRCDNGTPAANAGIKVEDIIVRVGNIPVKVETDVRDAMLNYSPGEKIEVEVIREKQRKTFNVTLTSPDKLPDARPLQQQPSNQSDEYNPFRDFKFPGMGDDSDANGKFEKAPRTGKVKLGVTVTDITPDLRKQYQIPDDVKGAIVVGVMRGYAAAEAGIQVGDIIEELGGKVVDSARSLTDAMDGRKWGEKCTLKFSRFEGDSSKTESANITF